MFNISSFARPVFASVALAAAVAASPAMAAGSLKQSGQALRAISPSAVTQSTLVFDVAGVFSVDDLGSPLNEVYSFNVGANATITSVAYDVTIFADNPSYLSEATVAFTNSAFSAGVFLNPGFFDDAPGTASYSDSVVLADIGLQFNVGADGILRLEFFESFDDFPDEWDAIWESGTLTFGIETVAAPIPEPSTYALMAFGLIALGAVARRRSSK